MRTQSDVLFNLHDAEAVLTALGLDRNDKLSTASVKACDGAPDCQWVGSATAEVRYFPGAQQDRTFSVTVNNLVFDLDEDFNGAGRYESYILVEAGPITWEASGTSGPCTVGGTMTLDPPGSDGDYTHTSDGELGGGMSIDRQEGTYGVIVSGYRQGAEIIITCDGNPGTTVFPVVLAVWTGPSPTRFKNGITTLAEGEYHDPAESYGGTWTWKLTQVK